MSCSQAISEAIPHPSVTLTLLIPYDRGDVLNKLHRSDAEIITLEHGEAGTLAHVRVREDLAAEVEPFVQHG